MTRTAKRILKYGSVVVGVVLLIPAVYLAYLYFTYIDDTVTTGSAYGFTIGQTKTESYRLAREKFGRGEIVGIDNNRGREEELLRSPWLEIEFHSVSAVADRFDQWNHWGLWLREDDPSLLAIVKWHGDRVSGVGSPGTLGDTWKADGVDVSIRTGQTYAEVYETLKVLDQSSGFEDLALRTGWMARRQPVDFTEAEFPLVEPCDEWTLLVDEEWSYFNTIELRFAEGALKAINRHRQYFELP